MELKLHGKGADHSWLLYHEILAFVCGKSSNVSKLPADILCHTTNKLENRIEQYFLCRISSIAVKISI